MARAVVTFHSIDDSGSVLSFAPRAFAQLIERLAATETPVVTFEELLRRDDGITLTFDDGMRSVFQHALPVLRDHGFPAHIFLTTRQVGRTSAGRRNRGATTCSTGGSRACARGGLRIECHTVTHPDLRELSPQQIVEECVARMRKSSSTRAGARR